MIKFFRHIRKSLLMENKTGKYFKYAIGEIVLVVIGILIALSINNWNENRTTQKKEKSVLIKLVEDLEIDSTNLSNQLNRANLVNKLHLDLYKIGQGKLDADSLRNGERLRHGIIFNSAAGTNDPQLSYKISNTKIRDQLVTYFNRLLFTEEVLKAYRNLLENRVRTYLAEWNLLDIERRFEDPENPKAEIYEDKLIKHLSESAFQQLLYETNVKVVIVVSNLERLKFENTALIELINKELKQNR